MGGTGKLSMLFVTKESICGALIALSMASAISVLHAQRDAGDWPTRAVTLVVPFAPGGGSDLTARVLAGPMGEVLNQNVIVENVTGAGGMVGSAHVARAAPDGYTI